MRLVNVRLNPDDARRVAELRLSGVRLSEIVRAAIRAAHAQQMVPSAGGRRPSDTVRALYDEFPDPTGDTGRADRRDRTARRALIVSKLRR